MRRSRSSASGLPARCGPRELTLARPLRSGLPARCGLLRLVRALAPATLGAALAIAVLSGCANGADTGNAITPGPKLPNGYSLPPGAAHYQVSTPTLSPSP